MRLSKAIATPLLIALWPLAAQAHEPREGDIWATAGLLTYRTVSNHESARHGPWAGGAIAAEADVDYNGGVEIAMLYLDKIYVRRRDDDVRSVRIKRMLVTTGYRHWFLPWISSGLAFYSSYSMGDPRVVTDERPSGEPLETSAEKITVYGLDGSLQWEMWREDNAAVVLDFRYGWPLTREKGEDADHFGALLGFKYLVPKRGRR